MPRPTHLGACAVGPAQLCSSSSCMADLFQVLLPSPALTCTKASAFLPPSQKWCCISQRSTCKCPIDRQTERGLCHVQINPALQRLCPTGGLSEQFSAKVSSSPISSPLFWLWPGWREPCLWPGFIPKCSHSLLPSTACPLLHYQLTPLCVKCD